MSASKAIRSNFLGRLRSRPSRRPAPARTYAHAQCSPTTRPVRAACADEQRQRPRAKERLDALSHAVARLRAPTTRDGGAASVGREAQSATPAAIVPCGP
jgi:hypothetical protein